MPKDDINYSFTEGGVVYDFYDVFVPGDYFREPSLFTWGYDADGNVGDVSAGDKLTPVTTFAGGTNWKQSSFVYTNSAAIKTDGTLWTWGQGNFGAVGDNTSTTRNTPVTTFAGGTNWKQVAVGYFCMAAIKTDGTLWVWGSTNNGRLGTNDGINRSTPVTTFAGGNNWKYVNASGNGIGAIKTDGTLWMWGAPSSGQLGNNITSITGICTPVTTFAGGNNWKTFNFVGNSVVAIKTDGTLWTWGQNSNGQLGVNDTTQRNTPVTTFAGGTNWSKVAGGYTFGKAIKNDGTLWVWGNNTNGSLGTNDTISRSTPVTTFAGGTNWKQGSTTASIKTDGTLWTWGSGANGRLGTNNTISRSTPVTTFAGGNNWKSVSGALACSAIQYTPDP